MPPWAKTAREPSNEVFNMTSSRWSPCTRVSSRLEDLMGFVCTINGANMGPHIASVSSGILKRVGIASQAGVSFP